MRASGRKRWIMMSNMSTIIHALSESPETRGVAIPAFFNPFWSAPARAFKCGSDVPVAMMSTSASEDLPATSMTTTSSAFLSSRIFNISLVKSFVLISFCLSFSTCLTFRSYLRFSCAGFSEFKILGCVRVAYPGDHASDEPEVAREPTAFHILAKDAAQNAPKILVARVAQERAAVREHTHERA